MIISLTGFMGCGKSTVGRELASLTGAVFVDLDELIVEREGRRIPEIFKDGEAEFRRVELEALRSVVDSGDIDDIVLSLGGGALTTEAARELVFSRTESVFLRTRLDTIRARLGDSDSSRPLFKNADSLYASREPVYSQAAHTVDTDGKSPRSIAEEILGILKA